MNPETEARAKARMESIWQSFQFTAPEDESKIRALFWRAFDVESADQQATVRE